VTKKKGRERNPKVSRDRLSMAGAMKVSHTNTGIQRRPKLLEKKRLGIGEELRGEGTSRRKN